MGISFLLFCLSSHKSMWKRQTMETRPDCDSLASGMSFFNCLALVILNNFFKRQEQQQQQGTTERRKKQYKRVCCQSHSVYYIIYMCVYFQDLLSINR